MSLVRGHVEAVGLVLYPGHLGPAALRDRLFASWAPGVRVGWIAGHVVVWFARPVELVAERAAGAPLVSAAEGASMRAGGAAGPGELELLVGGQLVRARFAEREPIDLAALVDLAGFARAELRPLGRPTPVEPEPPIAPVEISAPAAPTTRPPLGARLALFFTRLFERGRPPEGPAPAAAPSRAPAIPPAPPRWAPPKIFSRLVGPWLARLHGRYLARTLEMLDAGRLGEFLRHAIPLGGAEGGGDPGWFWLPSPRADLRLSGPRAQGGSLVVDGATMDLLRSLYRRAFDKLVALGRIDEAAFLRAELLGEPAAGVALLEEHGRLAAAARMAEAKALEAEEIVRLWFQAGEVDRALAIARRERAFLGAVTRLVAKGERERAEELRLRWADVLASGGAFLAAAAVLKDAPRGAGLARAFLGRAHALGGRTRGLALAASVGLDPAEAGPPSEVDRGLAGDDLDLQEGIATGLAELGPGGPADRLRRRALRALLADPERLGRRIGPLVLAKLLDGAGAPFLADLPPSLARPAPVDWPRPVVFADEEVGASPIHDAVALDGDRLLVARGPAGVEVVSLRTGRARRLDVPAHALVPSIHGDRALLLQHREVGLSEVRELDLGTGIVRPIGLLALQASASRYDGATWVVARPGELSILDVLAPRPRALWRLDPLPPIRALDASGQGFAFVVADLDGEELWQYSASPPRLLRRQRSAHRAGWYGLETPEPRGWDRDPSGELEAITAVPDGAMVVRRSGEGRRVVELATPALVPTGFSVDLGTSPAVKIRVGDDGRVVLSDPRGRLVVLDLRMRAVIHRSP